MTRGVGSVNGLPLAEGSTQYLLGALVEKVETSCCTRDLPHLGHFGGRFFRRSCSLIGTRYSNCLPHALHSNSYTAMTFHLRPQLTTGNAHAVKPRGRGGL